MPGGFTTAEGCGRRALLLNGRASNLEHGSRAPGAPDVLIDERKLRELWSDLRRGFFSNRRVPGVLHDA